VSEVAVEDNQPVRAGQVLVRVDPRDFVAKVERAEASLASAKAAVAVAQANVQAIATRGAKTAADVRRYAALREKAEVSQQEFDAAKAAADSAAAELQAANRQVTAAEADVAQRRAELAAAKLELSHTTLTAASAGRITKKAIEVGQYVQAGQPVVAVVADEDLWVIANYKETQLRGIRPGEPATIAVDALPRACVPRQRGLDRRRYRSPLRAAAARQRNGELR
jgi:membrane fusion protein (multidrug efflux system)